MASVGRGVYKVALATYGSFSISSGMRRPADTTSGGALILNAQHELALHTD